MNTKKNTNYFSSVPGRYLKLVLFALTLFIMSCKSNAIVQIDNGVFLKGDLVKSSSGSKVRAYRGVTFAKALRWDMPKLYQYPKGMHSKTKFGPVCPQSVQSTYDREIPSFVNEYGMNEDCLQLNIWTPLKVKRKKLPTIVWIHGGGFKSGVSYKKAYRGVNMAAKGVIFVSLNYRLNLFGFFAHHAQPKGTPKGNYGIYDQMEALKWIKKNIKNFGGDPNNITLMGESAGAVSVLTHLQNDHSKNLFNKAIVQSAIALTNTTPIDGPNESDTPTAVESSRTLAALLNCKNRKLKLELKCLKRRPLHKILKNVSGQIKKDEKVHSSLYIDHYTVKQSFHKTFIKGQFQKKPIIIGSNKDEATFFGKVPFRFPFQYKAYLYNKFNRSIAKKLLKQYPAKNVSQMEESWIEFFTDFLFTFDGLQVAKAGSKNNNKIYHYYFSRVGPGATLNKKGASHGFEIPYFLDNLDSIDAPQFVFNYIDDEIAKEMSNRIINFAKTGKPNDNKGVIWNSYNLRSRESLEINSRIEEIQNLLKKKMKAIKSARFFNLN